MILIRHLLLGLSFDEADTSPSRATGSKLPIRTYSQNPTLPELTNHPLALFPFLNSGMLQPG